MMPTCGGTRLGGGLSIKVNFSRIWYIWNHLHMFVVKRKRSSRQTNHPIHLVRKGCDGLTTIATSPQFLTSNVHFVRKGCDGHLKIAILPQFLASNVHFVRQLGCDGYFKIAILPQFLTSNVHFVRKGCDGLTKIAILPQFLTSNVHFVRKGCASWRSGGTAPA